MIVQESTPVHPAALGRPTHVAAYEPRVVPSLRRISEAVQREGAVMLAQISHRGLGGIPIFSDMPIWAPSAVKSPHTGEFAHSLGVQEINEVVDYFVRTARNFVDAGYDGVEVHLAHGQLLSSFLSSDTNRRDDRYGGSVENRLRISLEVLAAIRSSVDCRVLGVRMSVPGWPLAETNEYELSVILESLDRFVDYVSVTGGNQGTIARNVADHYTSAGYLVPLARAVRGHTSKPVIAAGQLANPQLAEDVVRDGAADLVGFARGMIADPSLAHRLLAGEAPRRRCIYCNVCLGRVDAGARIGCAVNPRTGRERSKSARRADPVAMSPSVPTVAVVGAGPAGLQASLSLAERGIRTVLFELEGRVGGKLNVVAATPGREVYAMAIEDLESAVRAQPSIELRLGEGVDVEKLGPPEFDGVVVAIGAERQPAFTGANAEVPVWSAEEVLADRGLIQHQRVLVVEEDGFATGLGAAEVLTSGSNTVSLVTAQTTLGWKLPPANRRSVMDRLMTTGVTFAPQTSVTVAPDGCLALQKQVPWVADIPSPHDAVVVSAASRSRDAGVPGPNKMLFASAGDVVAPRTLEFAVREGHVAASALAGSLLAAPS